MKAYYAKQDADKLSQFGDSSKTLTLMRSSADSLKKSAEVLGDVSLYEKKKFKKRTRKPEKKSRSRIMTGMRSQRRLKPLLTITIRW